MSAKDLRLLSIDSGAARAFIKRNHYSGKVAQNSQLNVGVFLGGELHGAMQLGPPLDRSKLIGLVRDTKWNGFLELNRMAFDQHLPRNSESRALGCLRRLLRRHRPDIEWLVSFADCTSCGDGTIYRAAGFLLTDVRESKNLARFPDGHVRHKMTLQSSMTKPLAWLDGRSYVDVTGGVASWATFLARTGGEILPGFQIRYLLPLADDITERLTIPVLPYSTLDDLGARMYRGKRGGRVVGPGDQPG